MNPTMPIPYVGGSISVASGAVQNLLALIQAQLAPNCPGTAVELQLVADAANTAPILVGSANKAGALSASNYAYQLYPDASGAGATNGGVRRIYRSNYPGTQAPIGELQLLTTATGTLHVELFT